MYFFGYILLQIDDINNYNDIKSDDYENEEEKQSNEIKKYYLSLLKIFLRSFPLIFPFRTIDF